jgi:hypothetical protein
MPKAGAKKSPYDRVRSICLSLPGVYEKAAWGEPTFRIERGKMFLMFADNHHDDGRVAVWCMSTPDSREMLQSIDPDRYFVPPYVGPSGWVGVRLEGRVDWTILEDVIREGHRLGAPKTPARKAAAKKPAAKKPAAKKPAAKKAPIRSGRR